MKVKFKRLDSAATIPHKATPEQPHMICILLKMLIYLQE